MQVIKFSTHQCSKCGQLIHYLPFGTNSAVKIRYGSGYEARTIECPKCNQINILSYREDFYYDSNKDERYYYSYYKMR